MSTSKQYQHLAVVESAVPAGRARRRRGPKHPGVVLIPPDPVRRIGWRARCFDPDTGKSPKVTLERGLRTTELREDWAVRKSKAIAVRRLELERGAPRATGTGLGAAVGRYFEDHPQLRPRTIEIYKRAAGKLVEWAAGAGVKSADDLTGSKLVAFRATLVKEPLRTRRKGGKRGEQRITDKPRSPSAVNAELRATRTVLGYLRRLGLLPRLSSDDLKDGLLRLAVSLERAHFLRPAEIVALLEAALKHDAETFAATREEHAGKREPGTTARYEPIAPFIACVLLTGMRFGEAVSLTWEQVDLDALDHDGKKVGEIHLTSATKTKRARTIGLEVSPALRTLLAAMRPDDATGSVFGLTGDTATAAARRLVSAYGAPARSNWQALRRTCGCYLTNAPGIFGAASAYRSAKQLGHSVAVAEKHYVDVVRGIQRDARNLETAMQISAEVQRVTDSIPTRAALRVLSDRVTPSLP